MTLRAFSVALVASKDRLTKMNSIKVSHSEKVIQFFVILIIRYQFKNSLKIPDEERINENSFSTE